jgi:hypothetical protein
MKTKTVAMFLGAMCLGFTMIQAQTIVVPNFSFENGLTNWTPSFAPQVSTAAANTVANNLGVTDGTQAAFINSNFGNLPISLTSSLLDTLVDNSTYSLTLALGNRVSGVSAGAGLYTIELLTFNGLTYNSVASTTVDGAGIIAADSWQIFSVNFNSTGSGFLGEQLAVRVTQSYNSATDVGLRQAFIDNVQLSYSAVPEPSTWAMLGLGFTMLMMLRLKPKKSV